MSSILEKVLNIFFPPRCIFCDEILQAKTEVNICSSCYKNIAFIPENPIRISALNGSNYFDAVVSVCRYSGIVKHSLIRYKFYNRPGYYRSFANLLKTCIYMVTNVERFDMIISVPLHKHKELSRGYNQALLISKGLSRETGISECSELLIRNRYTEAQSLLNKENRQKNVINAFKVTNAVKVENKYILLVDDILTTGNTLNECARILKEAGAKAVIAAVIATGQSV